MTSRRRGGLYPPPLLSYPTSLTIHKRKGGVPPPPRYFSHDSLRGKKKSDYKKDRKSGVFHRIMNPTVSHQKLEREEEEELLVQFEQFEQELKVENILKDVKKDLEFLKDDSVDRFAQQLQQRDQQRRLAQLEREELVF